MRGALALVVIALLGGNALADLPRGPVAQSCTFDGQSLPRNGSTNVPLNTRLWRLYRGIEVMREPLPDLAPGRSYDFPSQYVSFTTGDDVDRTPPAQPQIGAVWITVGPRPPGIRGDVAQLRISGRFSPDTAVLRLIVSDSVGIASYEIPADQLSIANPGFWIAEGNVVLEIVAIDLAGNESPPTWTRTTAAVELMYTRSCAPTPVIQTGRDRRASDPPLPPAGPLHHSTVVFVPLAVDLVVVLVAAMLAWRSLRLREKAPLLPLSLASVEQLARRARLRNAMAIVALVVAVGAVVPLGSDALIVLAILSPVLGFGCVVVAAAWALAQRALRLVTLEGAVAVVQHDVIIVSAASTRVVLRARPAAIRRAQLPSVDLK